MLQNSLMQLSMRFRLLVWTAEYPARHSSMVRLAPRPEHELTAGWHSVAAALSGHTPFRIASDAQRDARANSQMAGVPLFCFMQSTARSATLGLNAFTIDLHSFAMSLKLSHWGPGALNVHAAGFPTLSLHLPVFNVVGGDGWAFHSETGLPRSVTGDVGAPASASAVTVEGSSLEPSSLFGSAGASATTGSAGTADGAPEAHAPADSEAVRSKKRFLSMRMAASVADLGSRATSKRMRRRRCDQSALSMPSPSARRASPCLHHPRVPFGFLHFAFGRENGIETIVVHGRRLASDVRHTMAIVRLVERPRST